jgi:SAM-dependent methyltransferase
MSTNIDGGRAIDWGTTSADYATFRPGPPDDLYTRLQALGIGLPGQRILDLGTGTGPVARALARQGAVVSGVDIAPEQIKQARRLSSEAGLQIKFEVSPAEAPPFPEQSFDVATANQCFLYFDKPRTLAKLRRLLVSGGRLVTSNFNWLPRVDAIASASEALVLKFNPSWQGAGFDGTVVPVPNWVSPDIVLESFFWFDTDIPFSRETWRGRIRASRGVGATLAPEEVAAFDKEHAAMLAQIAPQEFTIKHRIDARILRFP